MMNSSDDTSRLTPKVVRNQNPLLSAAVTNLTFDDFQNQPLLLPPAPPPVVSSPIVQAITSIKEDSTPTATVGKTPEIDTNTLSEINLNSSAEDENENIPELQDDGSILSQAASSFSQLPSVASTVFSSFSRKIKDYTPTKDDNFNHSTYPPTEVHQPIPFDVNSNPAPPAEPPKFYSPGDVPTVQPGAGSVPPPVSGNTYRFSGKKKTYAPIPGLTSNLPTTTGHISPSVTPVLPPLPEPNIPDYQPQPQTYQTYNQEPSRNEDRRGGLFSNFTNLVAPISGFVQTATDTITGRLPNEEKTPNDSFQQTPQSFQIQTSNYFDAPTTGNNQVNYFNPTSEGTSNFFQTPAPPEPISHSSFGPPPSFLNPVTGQQQPTLFETNKQNSSPVVASSGPTPNFFNPVQDPSVQPPSFFNPSLVSEPSKYSVPVVDSNKPSEQAYLDPSSKSSGSAESVETSKVQQVGNFTSEQQTPAFFNPLSATSEANNPVLPPTSSIPTVEPTSNSYNLSGNTTYFSSETVSAQTADSNQQSFNLTGQKEESTSQATSYERVNQNIKEESFPPTGPPPAVFSLKTDDHGLQPSVSSASITSGPPSAFVPPPAIFNPVLPPTSSFSEPPIQGEPVQGSTVLPPTGVSGNTSFRLQKGTRLYKSPFQPQPQSFFNPTSQQTPLNKPPSPFVPQVVGQNTSTLLQEPIKPPSPFVPHPVTGPQNVPVQFGGLPPTSFQQENLSKPSSPFVSQALGNNPSPLQQPTKPPSPFVPYSAPGLQNVPVQFRGLTPTSSQQIPLNKPPSPFVPQALTQSSPPLEQPTKPPSPFVPQTAAELQTVPEQFSSLPPTSLQPTPNKPPSPFVQQAVAQNQPPLHQPTKPPSLFVPQTAAELQTVPEQFSGLPPTSLQQLPLNKPPSPFVPQAAPQDPTSLQQPANLPSPFVAQSAPDHQPQSKPPSPFVPQAVEYNLPKSNNQDQVLDQFVSSSHQEQLSDLQPHLQETSLRNLPSVAQEITSDQPTSNPLVPPPGAESSSIQGSFPPLPPTFLDQTLLNNQSQGNIATFFQPTTVVPNNPQNNFFQASPVVPPTSLQQAYFNTPTGPFAPPPTVDQSSVLQPTSTELQDHFQQETQEQEAKSDTSQVEETNEASESVPLLEEKFKAFTLFGNSQKPDHQHFDSSTGANLFGDISKLEPTSSNTLQEQEEPEATTVAKPDQAPPSANLTNFFTPTQQANFVRPATQEHFPHQIGFVVPPPDTNPEASQHEYQDQHIAPPPIGFDSIAPPPTSNATSETGVNPFRRNSQSKYPSVASFFAPTNSQFDFFSSVNNQTANISSSRSDQTASADHHRPSLQLSNSDESQPKINISDSSPEQATSSITGAGPEDLNSQSQSIQNFFNNPPPQDVSDSITGDLNYNLVGSSLQVNVQTRSLTPASNLVEPPSSSCCSDFSELNSSTASALVLDNTSNKTSPNEDLLPEDIVNELKMANILPKDGEATVAEITYAPATIHWFYKRESEGKQCWLPFTRKDSNLLEESFNKQDGPNIVPVESTRYDVNISERTKSPAYWEGEKMEVRRCSWFFKGSDTRYYPYDEPTSALLEEEYRMAALSGEWHKKVAIPSGETVVFHAPNVIVHFQQSQTTDNWGGSSQTTTRPRVVKRDLDDFHIEEGEPSQVDHLLVIVHGIGAVCDLKFRTIEEVVDEFRTISLQLVQSHYKNSAETGQVGRVEVLPISWYGELHSGEMGIDEKLKAITLESIPKLRSFTNDTLLDILFYTSPVFCQKIMNTVSMSINNTYKTYAARNPQFRGGVSLAGHSLGSLILFDLLCHQKPVEDFETNKENPDQIMSSQSNSAVTYTMGPAGTGQPFISYPQLVFQPKKFFALGSPIGVFVTVRGIDKLGLDFRLPTCPGFYNIFHPYDPVAYRIEALINTDLKDCRPVLIPHHKGRKRMHLELKETMSRVGQDIKQKLFDTLKNLDNFGFLGKKSNTVTDQTDIENEVDKVLEMQRQLEETPARKRVDSTSTVQSDVDTGEVDFPLGKLNEEKRVDYVLQEAPLEFFNEYIFALSSHVCYWDSADTILFVMKEIYTHLGVNPDSQVPQQSMTIERPSTSQQSP